MRIRNFIPAKKNTLYFFPAYIFAVLIFIASSLHTEKIQQIQRSNNLFEIIFSDYCMHSFAFGVFAFLLCLAYHKRSPSSFPFLKIGIISISFGLFIEIYQLFLPYRSLKLNDFASDIVGVVLALILFHFFKKEIYKKR
ncbi:MAG: VanZ family protein [Candidatus Aminicenantaceae bacterium]